VIACGVEEPLRPNGSVPSYDEETNNLYAGDDFTDPRLNRYSFVCVDNVRWSDDAADINHVLRAILADLDTPITTLKIQGRISPWEETGVSQRFLAERHDAGWETYAGTYFVAASKRIALSDIYISGEDVAGGWTRQMLMLGPMPPFETFMQTAFKMTEQSQRGFYKIMPGPRFLRALADFELIVAYLDLYDTVYNPGLIIVGTRQLDVAKLQERGLIHRIEDPVRVWTYMAASFNKYPDPPQ